MLLFVYDKKDLLPTIESLMIPEIVPQKANFLSIGRQCSLLFALIASFAALIVAFHQELRELICLSLSNLPNVAYCSKEFPKNCSIKWRFIGLKKS